MSVVWVISAASLTIAFSYVHYSRSHTPPVLLPPGPPRDILIGHARRIPSRKGWEVFSRWKETYGDVIYLEVLGRSIVVLNSVTAARDLLERKSNVFSDRPHFSVLYKMGWGLVLPFIPYGPRFRKHRRIFHQYFNRQALAAFEPTRDRELRKFLRRLLTKPGNFVKYIDDFIAGTIISVTYGHEVITENDPFVELIEDAVRSFTEVGSIGSTLLDVFPFMHHVPAWLPGMAVKRAIPKARELVGCVLHLPWQELKMKRANGSAPACLMSELMDKYEETHSVDHDHEEDIMNIGTAIYAAGSDTTKAVLKTFFLLMTIHPDVAVKIQEELDRTIGRDRLPCIDDRKELPYLGCVIKEMYRIHSTGPLGIPHRCMRTEQYRGWTIPEGTILIPNIWHMMRDEKIFLDPDSFLPERHMGKVTAGLDKATSAEMPPDGMSFVSEDDPSSIVFGFGRRACPGKHFADSTLWIAVASVLSLFDIKLYSDPKTRKTEVPKLEFDSDVVMYPKPFKCTITPRDAKRAGDMTISL